MFEGLFQPVHLVIIVLAILILFGPGKLPEVGAALGRTIREFRSSVQETRPEVGAGEDRSERTERPS